VAIYSLTEWGAENNPIQRARVQPYHSSSTSSLPFADYNNDNIYTKIKVEEQASMQDPNCAFCKIIAGKIPSRVIMENEKAMALLDAFPLAAGHTLVIPKLHYAKVQEMSKQDAMAVFEIMWKVASAVEVGSQVNASTIAIHNGSEAGQEVPHVHAHIVPRKRDDGAGAIHSMFKIKPKLDPQEMDSLRDRIASNLS
jgi:histidine triad (HIT) family protein